MTNKMKKVRCLVCGETLTYVNNDTSLLVEHLNDYHSGLEVFRYLGNSANSERATSKNSEFNAMSFEGGDNSISGQRPGVKRQAKATETWTAAPQMVHCPKCGHDGQPIYKRRQNKVARSPLGALCMLGCWPLCFLPYWFRDYALDAYCTSCQYFLGTYDQKKGCFIARDDMDVKV